MNALFSYLLQVTCISGLLYGYYHLALRNRQFHHYNRFYLVSAAFISLVIPFFNIPVYFTKSEAESSFVFQTLTVISSSGPAETNGLAEQATTVAPGIAWGSILSLVYFAVAGVVLLRIAVSLINIRRIVKENTVERLDNIRFVNTNEPGTPFSFFRWLFWNRNISLQSEKGEQIFRHELFHIKQRHSLDVIFLELLSVVCWINPFFHLVRKEIKAIHEFLADEFAIKENRKWEYAELLLMQVFHTNQRLVNPFFHNQIKRRIAMITNSQKPSYRYLRKIMVLPIAALAAGLFAFSYKKKQDHDAAGPRTPVTILIDAGHGGNDKGTVSPSGLLEKDIVLAIAKKIKSLNTDPNIRIVLTRESDEAPDLKVRTGMVKKYQPELFLSLHVNTMSASESATGNSGVEIYLPKKNKSFTAENKIFGSILLNYFSSYFTTKPVLKQAESNIWVLENTECPTALIELGFMSNPDEADFISKSSNQEKIANSILQSIDQYLAQKRSDDWDSRKSSVMPAGPFGSPIHPDSSSRITLKGSKDAISFIADSIFWKSDPSKKTPDLKTILYVINGQKMYANELAGKELISSAVTVYPANDEYAIRNFGSAAKNGVLIFENAKFVKADQSQTFPADTTPLMNKKMIFDRVEVEATFPGGAEAWKKFLMQNLDAGIPARKKAPEGIYSVIVFFVVDQDGKISNVETLTKHGYGMEDEAIRVVKTSPDWNPALQNGNKVSSYRKQPVTFVVGKGNKQFPAQVNNRPGHPGEEVVFESVSGHNAPSFPGGPDKWKEYLNRSINPLVPVVSGAPAGEFRVLVQFLVNTDGTISELKALTAHGYGMEQEAIKLLRLGPRWVPAMKDGKKIRAYVSQAVTFVITEEDGSAQVQSRQARRLDPIL